MSLLPKREQNTDKVNKANNKLFVNNHIHYKEVQDSGKVYAYNKISIVIKFECYLH